MQKLVTSKLPSSVFKIGDIEYGCNELLKWLYIAKEPNRAKIWILFYIDDHGLVWDSGDDGHGGYEDIKDAVKGALTEGWEVYRVTREELIEFLMKGEKDAETRE